MPRNPICRADVTNKRSSLIALTIHLSRFPKHEKALALMQMAGATKALLCDATLWKRFLARNVDRDRSALDGSRKLSCSGKHTANLVPIVEDMAWLLPEDDEDATKTSFSAFALALDKLALATVSKDKILLDGGETLRYMKEAFGYLHGPPVPGKVQGLNWNFAGLMTALVTLGLGTKEARDLIDFMIVVIMNCRTGRSSFDSLVHDGYIKELFEALWAFSRRVKGSTEALVEAGRVVHALEAAHDALAARDGLVALQGEDAVDSVAATLAPVAALLEARALADVSVEGALALVGAALPARRSLFATRRVAALHAFFGDDVNTDDPYDFCGDDWTGGGRHIQILRDTVDLVMDTRRQDTEIEGVRCQGVKRAAMARRVRGGETLRVVIATNHVRYLKWLQGQRLVEPFRVTVRSEDVFNGCCAAFPADRSVFFTEMAYTMVLVMLHVASEIAGRPVTFEEAGINIASVLIELAAFFSQKYSKRKPWVLLGAIGRQIGICNQDGTVSWDVDNDGQRCKGSRYFKAKPPSDADVPSLRGVMDIVRDPKTKAMIVGDETLEQAWRAVVKEGYDDRKMGPCYWAMINDQLASAAADALLLKRGAFLKRDASGGLVSVVVAFAGANHGPKQKQWHTEALKEVAETAAEGGATFFSGPLAKTGSAGKYDVVVFAAGHFAQIPTEVKERNGAVHLGFVEAATTLQEHGLEGAAINADLLAHWAAYRYTGREQKGPHGKFKVFEKRDPPSEPFPESLRVLVPAGTAAAAA